MSLYKVFTAAAASVAALSSLAVPGVAAEGFHSALKDIPQFGLGTWLSEKDKVWFSYYDKNKKHFSIIY
jgi:hypothetical protein